MRPAADTSFIAVIADRDGSVFEHVVVAPSKSVAEAQMRDALSVWDMTLIGVRPLPVDDAPAARGRGGRVIAFAAAITVAVSVLARAIVL